tara:strand:+ start:198 stop:530 length:333 start_codon:yes stop_codon:yes gene_type:complete
MATFQEKSNETNGGGSVIPPTTTVLTAASKLSIVEDKPIMLDYWLDSFNKENPVLIGVKNDDEKLLVKSAEEYTSPISKIYKTGQEYIIVTENSIYIVSQDIPTRKISGS